MTKRAKMTKTVRSARRLVQAVLVCFLLPQVPPTAFAQTVNASILGTVRDQSGAVVPGATVTITNEETGFTRAAMTDGQGDYLFPGVPIGNYTVTIAQPGFKKATYKGFTVHVAQEARLDVSLEVGEVDNVVEVTAEPPLITTDSASLGTVINRRNIVSLPLDGRNYTELAALAPGVSYTGFSQWSHNVSINGNRPGKTEFLIDGLSNTETWYGGALLSPSLDAIEEFRVQANMTPAEFGRGAGWVNAVTKSGTNEFHGVAYEFHRNDAVDARNFFALAKPKLIRNQFGGDIGGPVLKNRLFFYGDYEGTRQRKEATTNVGVPTAALRQGDFSSLLSKGVIIRDPLTGQPFPDNRIPANRLSPIATYFQPFMALPNTADARFIHNSPIPLDEDRFSIRMDHQSSQMRVTGRLLYANTDSIAGTRIYGNDNPLGSQENNVKTVSSVLSVQRTLTPNLLFELRGGYYYNHFFGTTAADQTDINHVVKSGIGGFVETTAPLGHGGFPDIFITGFGGIPGGSYRDIKPKGEVQSYMASVIWRRGPHSVKAGVEHRRELGTTEHYNVAKGQFIFTGFFTRHAYGDYLLGYPLVSSRAFPQDTAGSRTNLWHFYVQDDWRVTPNLTLNLGMRFEYNPFPNPIRAASNFDPELGKVIVSSRGGLIDLYSETSRFAFELLRPIFITSEEAGVPYNLMKAKGGFFNPRFGFAWRPFGNNDTVIRGGAGIFTVPNQQQITRGSSIINPPWLLSENKVTLTPTPWATYWKPVSQETAFGAAFVTAADPEFYNAASYQWNLTVERRLPARTGLSVSYVGHKTNHLHLNYNLNQPEFGPNAFKRVPFPQFGVFAQGLTTGGDANHHALHARVDKQLSHGLSFLASYSWSKTIDMTSADNAFLRNRFNFDADRGLSGLDTGHRLVTSWVYDLPFGRGRSLASEGWLAPVVGGWQLTGIATFQSGPVFSVLNSPDTSGFFVTNGQFADRVCGGESSHPTLNKWFDTSCFVAAKQYTAGNAGRHILRADGTANFDLGVNRNIRFTEQRYLQFRFDAFNAFNHVKFRAPFSTIGVRDAAGNELAGRVTSAGPARILQFGLKFYF